VEDAPTGVWCAAAAAAAAAFAFQAIGSNDTPWFGTAVQDAIRGLSRVFPRKGGRGVSAEGNGTRAGYPVTRRLNLLFPVQRFIHRAPAALTRVG